MTITKENRMFATVALDDLSKLVNLTAFLKENEIELIRLYQDSQTAKFAKHDTQKFGRYGLAILEKLADGKKYKEISTELDISIDGVRFYIKKIFKALNVNNGRDAVRIYLTDIK